MPVKFCPLASGSNGNSIFIGSNKTKILIDAGISGKRIEHGLRELDVYGDQITGIFVTHEHSDHICGLGVMSRRYDIPIYATPKTWRYFERHSPLGKVAEKNKRIIYSGTEIDLEGLRITPFDIPHDSSEPVGYSVQTDEYKICVVTDLGYATEEIKESIKNSDMILLESNHDVEMLINGSYPKLLKERVLGNRGHLSNANAGKLLAETISDKLKYVFLGHLSEENNLPLLAMDTVKNVLSCNGINPDKSFKIMIAQRGEMSDPIEL